MSVYIEVDGTPKCEFPGLDRAMIQAFMEGKVSREDYESCGPCAYRTAADAERAIEALRRFRPDLTFRGVEGICPGSVRAFNDRYGE